MNQYSKSTHRTKTRILVMIAAILGVNAIAIAAPPVIPIEDFVKLRGARDVQVSPDGSYLSVIMRRDGEEVLAILNSKTREIIRGFNVTGKARSVGKVDWVNDERVVYRIYETLGWTKQPNDVGDLIGVNIDGSRHELLFGLDAGEQQTGSRIPKKKASKGDHEIIDRLPDDKKNILIVFYPYKRQGNYIWRDDKAIAQVNKLNVYSGKMTRVIALPLPLATALTDNAGRVRFSIGTDKDNVNRVFYREINGEEWTEFHLDDFEGTDIFPVSFGAGDQSVYLTAAVDGGTRALYLVDLQDGAVEKLFHHPKVDISAIMHDFTDTKVIAASTELGVPEYHYWAPDDPKTKMHRSLKRGFAGKDVWISSQTDAGDKAVVRTYSGSTPGEYYLFDTATSQAEYLISERKWIDPKAMATVEPMTFTTRDGASIYGYLTRPSGSADNLPLVVMPHGGPHGSSSRDYWGFEWEHQLLANRGYAVLTVNFRGTGGFGNDYETQGHGQWGALMQDDVTDATRSLIESKIADPQRICIYGHSYGGYSALMGAVREPDLYRCAIGSMGIYDLTMMFKKGDIADSARGRSYLSDVLGDDVEVQKQRSPVYNVDKIKADVMLIHGALDQRAPIRQAKSLMSAFDGIDKSYRWLELSDETHGYYDEGNRKRVYSEILDFLEDSIGE